MKCFFSITQPHFWDHGARGAGRNLQIWFAVLGGHHIRVPGQSHRGHSLRADFRQTAALVVLPGINIYGVAEKNP
jgi:hypothetical protein